VETDSCREHKSIEVSQQVDKTVDKILGNNPFVLKGDEWKERRAEITPGLSPNRVRLRLG